MSSFKDYVNQIEEGNSAREQAELDAFRVQYARAVKLLSLRQRRSLTQVELATRSGVDQAEISRLERGVGNPTEQTLHRLATALGAHWELVDDHTDEPVPTA